MSNLMEFKNGWERVDKETKKDIFDFCEAYKKFLDNSKTERLCCTYAIETAKNNGFLPIENYTSLKPGDKVIINNRGKSVAFAVIGSDNILNGINMVAAHIDSPRLDLKQNPLYEDMEMAQFKTHYYGGIKKYQWTTIPLAIHGVVVKRNGKMVDISVGEDDNDPIFCVSDLLIHLSGEQMKKKLGEAIEGEKLSVIIGSMPDDSEKDKVKSNIMNILNEKYGIEEEDFVSAELEVVPSGKARDLGFDRSLIGAYGQDDRVCAYTAFKGILDAKKPEKTAFCLLADKEEVGSMGNTGMKSAFFANTVAKIISLIKNNYNDMMLRETLSNSKCLSADVCAATDPNYKEVADSYNAPKFNYGVAFTKYTGARGKSGSNDASAELVGFLRKLCNDNGIIWQTGELGKVDAGGGGTVAQYVANLNIDTIDCGVALLSMHSPLEISSKFDVYMTYKTYNLFYLA